MTYNISIYLKAIMLIVLCVTLILGCTSKVQQIEDCGVSRSDIFTVDAEGAFENDSALVCLGNNLLDNCKRTKFVYESKDRDRLNIDVQKGTMSKCILRLEYETGDNFPSIEIVTEENEKENYVTCSFDIKELKSKFSLDATRYPATFAQVIIVYGGFSEACK